MRNFDRNFDSQSFVYQCESTLKKYSEIFFRSSASDSPKWEDTNFENQIVIKSRLKEDLVLLAIFSWYMPEEIGILLRFELQEICDKNPEAIWLHFLIKEKGLMYNYLCDTKLWSTRDFFGNILTKKRLNKIKYLYSLKFKTKKKPKRVQRHRGYRDKGTLRNIHEYHSFASCTGEQMTIEENRAIHKDTLSFLQGFLE